MRKANFPGVHKISQEQIEAQGKSSISAFAWATTMVTALVTNAAGKHLQKVQPPSRIVAKEDKQVDDAANHRGDTGDACAESLDDLGRRREAAPPEMIGTGTLGAAAMGLDEQTRKRLAAGTEDHLREGCGSECLCFAAGYPLRSRRMTLPSTSSQVGPLTIPISWQVYPPPRREGIHQGHLLTDPRFLLPPTELLW